MATIRIGDVVEIATAKGLAYAQCTHRHEQWGELLRILPGFFRARPAGFAQVVQQREVFVTFFPLKAAASRKLVSIVANEQVPPESQRFPLFRAAGFVDSAGRVHDWWLWDGERTWRIGQLTGEQRCLPIRAVCNDTALKEMIEQGWTPEADPRSRP